MVCVCMCVRERGREGGRERDERREREGERKRTIGLHVYDDYCGIFRVERCFWPIEESPVFCHS